MYRTTPVLTPSTRRTVAARRRAGSFLPSFALTELTACLAAFLGLATVIAFMPGGDAAASAGAAGREDSPPIRRLVAIGPGTDRLAVLTDQVCHVHDQARAGGSTAWISDGNERVTALAGSHSDASLLLGLSDGTVRLLDTESFEPKWERSCGEGLTSSADFSPDGRMIAVGFAEGAILLLGADDGRLLSRIDAGLDVRVMQFTPDGLHLLIPFADGSLVAWDIAGGREASRLPTDAGYITSLAVSDDGRLAVLGTGRGELIVADLAGRRIATRREVSLSPLLSIAFLPGTREIGVGLLEGPIGLLSVDDLSSRITLEGHRYGTRSLVTDGDRFLSAGLDGKAVAWNPVAGTSHDLFAE